MIAQQGKHDASVTGCLSAHSKVMEIRQKPKWFFSTDTNGWDPGTAGVCLTAACASANAQ